MVAEVLTGRRASISRPRARRTWRTRFRVRSKPVTSTQNEDPEMSTSSKRGSVSSLATVDSSNVEKAGYLHKWTNYLKGYRQRWFVIDKNGVLSYYRSPKEVGHTCRGSINLNEARIYANQTVGTIVVTAASQTFHLKASNDADRERWVSDLEYSRHKAIRRAESEEDEDAELSAAGTTRVEHLQATHRELATKLVDFGNSIKLLMKQSDDLVSALNAADGESLDRSALADRADLLKATATSAIKNAEEFLDLSEQGAKKLGKIVETEQKEKNFLQEQLETLAKQHSSLERAATINRNPISAYSDQEDEFHDAEEELSNTADSPTTKSFVAPVAHASKVDVDVASSSSPQSDLGAKRTRRRTTIPERPNLPINLWSIMKNCIGRDLSKIPMPVNFSEPISVLQRVTEDLEYANVLETAAEKDALVQMCYVAAYAASNYSTTLYRTNKPFNPLLGETYECDRTDDLGWKSITEQVSHHPPAAAHFAEGRGWQMYQDFTMTSRFRGKYLSVIPIGYSHVVFPASKNHYSYQKITTTVHNIIVGKLWIDNHGDMEITNHTTGDKCVLKFIPYSYFSRETPRKVYGIVRDSSGTPKYVVQGTWDKSIDMLKVINWSGSGEKIRVDTDEKPVRIWTVNPPIPGADKLHNFTKLAIELNESEPGVAPTDSRLRPDQRLMEDGRWDEANKRKLEIEEKQRAVRRKRETEVEKAMQRGEPYEEYQPVWFEKVQDEANGALIHHYRGGYWEAKAKGEWSKCPTIF